MNVFKSIVVPAIVMFAAGVATAAPGGKFGAADGNKDGALTRAEACAGKTRHICKNFEVIDLNKDGAVTRAEVKAFRNAKRAAKGLPAKA